MTTPEEQAEESALLSTWAEVLRMRALSTLLQSQRTTTRTYTVSQTEPMTFESRHLGPIEELADSLTRQARSYFIRVRRTKRGTIYRLKVLTDGH
jgi:hypothetical protein